MRNGDHTGICGRNRNDHCDRPVHGSGRLRTGGILLPADAEDSASCHDPSDHPWMGRYRRLVGYDPGLAFPGRAVPAAFQEQKMAADQIDLIRAAVF